MTSQGEMLLWHYPRRPLTESFGFFYFQLVAVCAIAFMFYFLEYAHLFNAFIFAAALFGFVFPARLMEGFVFLMALNHREFAYTTLTVHGANLYITEWVLLILLLAAVPKVQSIFRRHMLPAAMLVFYFMVGFVLFLVSFRAWPLYYALRDFTMVYYALFAIATLAHVQGMDGVRRIGMALVLGTLPNLAAEWLNYLYGTLPMTMDQKNYSMRNSFYYAASIGFVLGFITDEEGKWRKPLVAYVMITSLIILLYSYSKTPMLTLLLLGVMYCLRRWKVMRWKEAAAMGALVIITLIFTPSAKTFHFTSIFRPATYFHDSRTLLHILAIRDFVEYPYGIGFGASVFGDNAHMVINNPEEIGSLHNSYLVLLRRMGIEGAIVFFSTLMLALYGAVRAFQVKSGLRNKMTVVAMLGAWGATAVFASAHVALEGPFFGAVFWILLGCLFAASGEDGAFPVSALNKAPSGAIANS